MRTSIGIIGAALITLLAHSASAQVLGNIAASPATVKAGEPVTVTATIDVLNSNYCGFVVGFGDGTSQDGVSDSSTPSPMAFTHTYAKAGSYHVTLGGRNVQSHPNCGGAEKATTVTVTAGAKAASTGAAAACPAGWKRVAKSSNAKTGALTCSAKPRTALPATNLTCPGNLTYFENGKKGLLGCRP